MASASASSATRMCALVCRQAPRLQTIQPRVQRFGSPYVVSRRAFTNSTARWEGEPPKKEDAPVAEEATSATGEETAKKRSVPMPVFDVDNNLSIAGEAQKEYLSLIDETAKDNGYGSAEQMLSQALHAQGAPGNPRAEREIEKALNDAVTVRPDRRSFWFDEEDPEMDTDEVEDFNEDDMPEMAHAKLEEIKEMRQYQRLAVWELPLLSKLAKPFTPPSEKEVLRWRYTTYFGDTHPAEKKVVVQFAPEDLKLTKVQTEKLKKLAGTRYNPQNEMVKMSCESYEHQVQNKRYLLDVVQKLIAAAKDPKDDFADVPLDTRHRPVTTKPRFPKEWLMTEERQMFLKEQRSELEQSEVKRTENGQVVDGKLAIEAHLLEKMNAEMNEAKTPEMVAAPARSNARSMPRAKRA